MSKPSQYVSLSDFVEESFKKRAKKFSSSVANKAKDAGKKAGNFAKSIWSDDSHMD